MPRLTDIPEIEVSHKRIYTNNLTLWRDVRSEISRLGSDANLNHLDVSKITNMFSLFCATGFCGDVSLWDVTNVSIMEGMFAHTKFNGDLSLWDTKNLKNANSMFSKSNFNSDIRNWNVKNLRYMNMMFASTPFNYDISEWQLYKPIGMSKMFWGCDITFCMDRLADRITEYTDVTGILDNTPNYKFNRSVFREKSTELKRIANETDTSDIIRNIKTETDDSENII